MNKFLCKATSLFLSAALTASLLAVPAAASQALGEDLSREDTLVHESTTLSTNVFWSTTYSDLRQENLITYSPNSSVTPVITYGSALTSRTTVDSMAKELEAQGYRVVAGINGDFYDTGNGAPVGLVMTDGQVRSSDGGCYAIGFREDGSAVLGKPGLSVKADLGYQTYDSVGYGTEVVVNIAGINKVRSSTSGIFLFTYDFNDRHTTGNAMPGVDVLCTIEDGSLSIGGTLTLRVDEVIQATGATAMNPDQVVISVNNQVGSYFVGLLSDVPVGGTITVSLTAADESWNDVECAIGALYSLLENGSVVSGLPTGAHPRTAVGQKADGTLVFYTIDGRQSGLSIGATLNQVAARLAELGCVTALCLDGGGSTTLTVTKPDSTRSAVVNSPSDGGLRAVSNHLFLVADNDPTGKLDHFYVSPDSRYVLAGSKVMVSVSPVDTNYIPMAHTYKLTTDGGSLKDNVLTTPASGGEITVTASSGSKSGSSVVHAIATPDSISVKNGSTALSSLIMTPGSSQKLTAGAVYNHLTLQADPEAFTWTLDGNIGTVDAAGTITASAPGSGTLTVSAGGKNVSIPVTVTRIALNTVEDFESGVPALTSYSYGASLTANTAPAYVQMGRRSGKLDYTLDDTGMASAVFEKPCSVGAAYTQLNLWVYGDGSGATLSLLTSDGTTVSATDAAVLGFTGWRMVSVALPAGTAAVTGFQITGAPELELDAFGDQILTYPVSSGTLYLDQLTASYSGMVDQEVPVISAALDSETGIVTAAVSDAVDGILPRSAVTVRQNGQDVSFRYDAASGQVTVSLPDLTGNHEAIRLTITAKDASGNIGRTSVDVGPSGVGHKFTDIEGYWAADYVDFLYNAGITTGYQDGTFRPGQNISRQQFAVMLFRYLGLDGSQYEDVELPFADLNRIGDYALTAIKALYTLGVIGGTERNGKLYMDPESSLTRAQAAAMIGRTQEKGYASAELTFSDAGSIPAYAAGYIRTMVAQGVLSGYEDGSFKPNANITRGQMAKILYNLL